MENTTILITSRDSEPDGMAKLIDQGLMLSYTPGRISN